MTAIAPGISPFERTVALLQTQRMCTYARKGCPEVGRTWRAARGYIPMGERRRRWINRRANNPQSARVLSPSWITALTELEREREGETFRKVYNCWFRNLIHESQVRYLFRACARTLYCRGESERGRISREVGREKRVERTLEGNLRGPRICSTYVREDFFCSRLTYRTGFGWDFLEKESGREKNAIYGTRKWFRRKVWFCCVD